MMGITRKFINKEKVKPIPVPEIDLSKVKGRELFSEIYSNIFLLAKKKSGKTTVINHILKKCIDKDTKVYIFASTSSKDSSWIHIIKELKNKGNEVEVYQSIHDGKENILDGIIKVLNVEAEIELLRLEELKGKPRKKKLKYIAFDDSDDDEEENERKRKKRKKKISPEVLFIFDDLSTELRDPSIDTLVKKNRHYKSKCIISSQYIHDMRPEALRQLDYLLVFAGQTDEKLLKLHQALDLSINFELFKQLYKDATSKKYCFLNVSSNDGIYKRCFNEKYFLM